MKNLFNKTNKGTTTANTIQTKGGVNMKNSLNKQTILKGASVVNEAAAIISAAMLVAQGAQGVYHYFKNRKANKELEANIDDTLNDCNK